MPNRKKNFSQKSNKYFMRTLQYLSFMIILKVLARNFETRLISTYIRHLVKPPYLVLKYYRETDPSSSQFQKKRFVKGKTYRSVKLHTNFTNNPWGQCGSNFKIIEEFLFGYMILSIEEFPLIREIQQLSLQQ